MRRTVASSLLLSSLFFTAAAYASPSADAATTPIPVSTGITPPEVLNSLSLSNSPLSGHALPADRLIEVSFTVNQNGQPSDVKIVKGSDIYWNSRVVNAVLNLRYRPASMDNHAIPMVVNMNVNLE